jgi:Na+/H+ antiporter NhaA
MPKYADALIPGIFLITMAALAYIVREPVSAQAYNQARDLHEISVTLKEIARTLKDKCP